MTMALRIDQAAMCCALGYSLEAASAAIRACLDHFRESWFVDRGGRPLHCAMIWDNDLWGPSRMGFMFEHVLAEIFHKAPECDPGRTCLMLLTPEESRPGSHKDWAQEIFAACTDKVAFHESSRICPGGRAGIGLCLHWARDVLAANEVEQLLLAGVDSYLTVGAIEHLLDTDRLLAGGASDGFIPGEGAGGGLLRKAKPGVPGLHVSGVGLAHEASRLDSDEPANRSEAFTAAVRAAVAECGFRAADIDLHMSDCSGESFYIKEIVHGLVRVVDREMPEYHHMMIAPYLGETGAAVGPLILAFLTDYMPRMRKGRSRALLNFANDGGERAAVMLETR